MHTANSVKHPRRFMVVWDESDGGMGSLIWNPLTTRAEAGGFAGNAMIYSQWNPGQPADLFNTGEPFNRKVNTALDERHPTMFKRWLLFTEQPGTRAGTKSCSTTARLARCGNWRRLGERLPSRLAR